MITRKIWIFLLLFIISTSTSAQNSLPTYKIVSDTGFTYKLDKGYWQKLEDQDGKWTFDEVKRLPLSNKFHSYSTPSVAKDSVTATIWIRFNLQNTLNKIT